MNDELGQRLEKLEAGAGRLIMRSRSVQTEITYPHLYDRSTRLMGALRANGVGVGSRVAVLMNTSVDAVTAIVATLRAGATLVPMYPYPRPNHKEHNRAAVGAVLRSSRAAFLLAPNAQVADYQAALATSALPAKVMSLEQCAEFPASVADDNNSIAPALIQYSSGSTGNPKGVVIEREALRTCVDSVTRRNSFDRRSAVASWLPLYHDFGLVGGLLQALLQGSSIWLMPSQDFIRDPLSWIKLISDSQATFTGAPNFAYQLCAAKLASSEVEDARLDLSHLALATNAAEPVLPATIRSFHVVCSKLGLGPNVVQPTYGLAENCAAATMPARGASLKTIRVSRRGLSEGRLELDESAEAASRVEYASLGAAVDGCTIRVVREDGAEGDGIVGRVYLSGQTATERYVDANGHYVSTRGPYGVDTGDFGALLNRELIIVGRSKDLFKYGGKAFDPSDIEVSLGNSLGPSVYAVGVFSTNPLLAGSDQINVVVEMRDRGDSKGFEAAADNVRQHIRQAFGIPIAEVIALRRGQLPKTTSGKLRRAYLRQLHESSQLETALDVIGRTPPRRPLWVDHPATRRGRGVECQRFGRMSAVGQRQRCGNGRARCL